MNTFIRVLQVVLVLLSLNGIFGLVMFLTFGSLYESNVPNLRDIIGSVATIFIYVLGIFLLQKYYEKRNGGNISAKKFAALSLALTGIVVCVGIVLVILFVIAAFLHI